MYILCACAHIYVFVCAYACECKFSFLKLVSMLNISDTCRASPEGGRHFHVKSFSKATYCLNATVTIIHLSHVCLSPSPSLTLSF